MSQRHKVAGYLLLNATALVAVILIGIHLVGQIETIVLERLRLGSEFRSVRLIHRLMLDAANLADDVVVESTIADLPRYRSVMQMAENEADSLEELPPSPATAKALMRWKKENDEFEALFEQVVSKVKEGGTFDLRQTFRALKSQADDQVRILQPIGDALKEQINTSDAYLRRLMATSWTQVVALCLIPFGAIVILVLSFTRSLSQQVVKLEQGFEQFAAGNFRVRVSDPMAVGRGQAISTVLESFDRTAADLENYARMKSQFLSMAAHDLRSPLSTIKMAILTLEDSRLSSEDRALRLGIIKRRADQLLKLSETLLDTAFLQSGRIETLLQRVDINELMRRCVEDFALQAGNRHQTFEVTSLPGDATLWCDSVKLYQILENLVSNALKYSCEGDTIQIGASEPDGGTVLFHVKDHGPGIPETDRRLIFEPFHRAEDMTKLTQGHGLGLPICKAFVDAHGGTIWVESEPGAGSRFCFTIPRQSDGPLAQPSAPR